MSKTTDNLKAAFAGESQARNKYTFFAEVARQEGYHYIAKIFEETAENEKQYDLSPRLAQSHELEGMYEQVENLLDKIGFLNTNDSTYWMRNIRHFLGRVGLRAKEARIIRGFCRQFLWYDEHQKKWI